MASTKMTCSLESLGCKPRTGSILSCKTCSTEFYLRPALVNRGKYGNKFCSKECSNKSFIKPKLVFQCRVCSKNIFRPIYYVKLRGEPKYCSRDCCYKVSRKYPESGTIIMNKKKMTPSRKNIKHKLDYTFSRYIRLRDTQEGYGHCCSCNKRILFEEGDAGHFINRRWMSTRWREDNVFLQCRPCNRFDEGNAAGYGMFMIDKFGKKHVEYLNALKYEYTKYTEPEIELLIKEYKKKIKDLEVNQY
jgi:hypothetical protein